MEALRINLRQFLRMRTIAIATVVLLLALLVLLNALLYAKLFRPRATSDMISNTTNSTIPESMVEEVLGLKDRRAKLPMVETRDSKWSD